MFDIKVMHWGLIIYLLFVLDFPFYVRPQKNNTEARVGCTGTMVVQLLGFCFWAGRSYLFCYDLHQSTIDLVFFVVGVGLGFRISDFGFRISELVAKLISSE